MSEAKACAIIIIIAGVGQGLRRSVLLTLIIILLGKKTVLLAFI
jgi:hypothetical protein